MCILWHVNRIAWEHFTVKQINGEIYTKLVDSGAMRANCFVEDWDEAFRLCGLPVQYTGRHEAPDYVCAHDEIEILRFPGHFVAGDGRGNVTYDPMGQSSAVKTGPLESKRVFRLV